MLLFNQAFKSFAVDHPSSPGNDAITAQNIPVAELPDIEDAKRLCERTGGRGCAGNNACGGAPSCHAGSG